MPGEVPHLSEVFVPIPGSARTKPQRKEGGIWPSSTARGNPTRAPPLPRDPPTPHRLPEPRGKHALPGLPGPQCPDALSPFGAWVTSGTREANPHRHRLHRDPLEQLQQDTPTAKPPKAPTSKSTRGRLGASPTQPPHLSGAFVLPQALLSGEGPPAPPVPSQAPSIREVLERASAEASRGNAVVAVTDPSARPKNDGGAGPVRQKKLTATELLPTLNPAMAARGRAKEKKAAASARLVQEMRSAATAVSPVEPPQTLQRAKAPLQKGGSVSHGLDFQRVEASPLPASGPLLSMSVDPRSSQDELRQVQSILGEIRPLTQDVKYFCATESDPHVNPVHGSHSVPLVKRMRQVPKLRNMMDSGADEEDQLEPFPEDRQRGSSPTGKQRLPVGRMGRATGGMVCPASPGNIMIKSIESKQGVQGALLLRGGVAQDGGSSAALAEKLLRSDARRSLTEPGDLKRRQMERVTKQYAMRTGSVVVHGVSQRSVPSAGGGDGRPALPILSKPMPLCKPQQPQPHPAPEGRGEAGCVSKAPAAAAPPPRPPDPPPVQSIPGGGASSTHFAALVTGVPPCSPQRGGQGAPVAEGGPAEVEVEVEGGGGVEGAEEEEGHSSSKGSESGGSGAVPEVEEVEAEGGVAVPEEGEEGGAGIGSGTEEEAAAEGSAVAPATLPGGDAPAVGEEGDVAAVPGPPPVGVAEGVESRETVVGDVGVVEGTEEGGGGGGREERPAGGVALLLLGSGGDDFVMPGQRLRRTPGGAPAAAPTPAPASAPPCSALPSAEQGSSGGEGGAPVGGPAGDGAEEAEGAAEPVAELEGGLPCAGVQEAAEAQEVAASTEGAPGVAEEQGPQEEVESHEVAEVPESEELHEEEAPDVPESHEVADVPEVPEAAGVQEVVECMPEVAEIPDTPEAQEAAREAPEAHEVAEVPETAESPETHEEPVVPDSPKEEESHAIHEVSETAADPPTEEGIITPPPERASACGSASCSEPEEPLDTAAPPPDPDAGADGEGTPAACAACPDTTPSSAGEGADLAAVAEALRTELPPQDSAADDVATGSVADDESSVGTEGAGGGTQLGDSDAWEQCPVDGGARGAGQDGVGADTPAPGGEAAEAPNWARGLEVDTGAEDIAPHSPTPCISSPTNQRMPEADAQGHFSFGEYTSIRSAVSEGRSSDGEGINQMGSVESAPNFGSFIGGKGAESSAGGSDSGSESDAVPRVKLPKSDPVPRKRRKSQAKPRSRPASRTASVVALITPSSKRSQSQIQPGSPHFTQKFTEKAEGRMRAAIGVGFDAIAALPKGERAIKLESAANLLRGVQLSAVLGAHGVGERPATPQPNLGAASQVRAVDSPRRDAEQYSALLIGVEDYTDRRISSCPGTASDVALMAALLQKVGYRVEALYTGHPDPSHTPSHSNIVRVVESIRKDPSRRKGQHFVYFAGRTVTVRENPHAPTDTIVLLPENYKLPSSKVISSDESLTLQSLRLVPPGKVDKQSTGDDQQITVVDSSGLLNGVSNMVGDLRHGFGLVRSSPACSDLLLEYTADQRALITLYLAKALEGSAARDGKVTNVSVNLYIKGKLAEDRVPDSLLRSCSDSLAAADLEYHPSRYVERENYEDRIARTLLPFNFCCEVLVDAASVLSADDLALQVRTTMRDVIARHHQDRRDRDAAASGSSFLKRDLKIGKRKSISNMTPQADHTPRPLLQRREAAATAAANLRAKLGVSGTRVVSVVVHPVLVVSLEGELDDGQFDITVREAWQEAADSWAGTSVRSTLEPGRSLLTVSFRRDHALTSARMLQRHLSGDVTHLCGSRITGVRCRVTFSAFSTVNEYFIIDRAQRLGRFTAFGKVERVVPWGGSQREHGAATLIQKTWRGCFTRILFRVSRWALENEAIGRTSIRGDEATASLALWEAFLAERLQLLEQYEWFLRSEIQLWEWEDLAHLLAKASKDFITAEPSGRLACTLLEERERAALQGYISLWMVEVNGLAMYPFMAGEMRISQRQMRQRVVISEEQQKVFSNLVAEIRISIPQAVFGPLDKAFLPTPSQAEG